MTNIFFPDERVTKDDLYFMCYMVERVARKIKQKNSYVINTIVCDSESISGWGILNIKSSKKF